MKQSQAWGWSGAEAQGWERCSGQACLQKAGEHKYEWVGGVSLGMENRVGDTVSWGLGWVRGERKGKRQGSWRETGFQWLKVREYEKHDTGMHCKRHDYPWNESILTFKQGCPWGLQNKGSTPHPSAGQTALSLAWGSPLPAWLYLQGLVLAVLLGQIQDSFFKFWH